MFTTVTALCLRRQEVRFLQRTKRMGHTHHTCAYIGRYHGYAIGLFQLQCLDANCSVDLSLEGSTLVQLLQPVKICNPQTPILKHQKVLWTQVSVNIIVAAQSFHSLFNVLVGDNFYWIAFKLSITTTPHLPARCEACITCGARFWLVGKLWTSSPQRLTTRSLCIPLLYEGWQ